MSRPIAALMDWWHGRRPCWRRSAVASPAAVVAPLASPGTLRGCVAVVAVALAAAAPAADYREAERRFYAGEYEQALEMAREEAERNVWSDRWHQLLLRALLELGRYEEALREYESATEQLSRRSVPMRMLGVEVYRWNNKPREAQEESDRLFELLRRNPSQYASKENLVALGRYFASRGEEAREILELFYDRARKSDPNYAEAYVATAELALEKRDDAVAAEALEKAASLRPEDPQIAYLAARAWADSDPQRASEHLARALQLNPRHQPSLLLRAENAIDAEDDEEAAEAIKAVLMTNVHEPRAWALLAVMAHLRGAYEVEQQMRDAALSTWQTNPHVDHLIGRKLSHKYRFAEGAEAQRRALAFDPDFLPARFALAQDLLRLGEDEEGWQLAHEVQERDAYNVVAHNLVTLHDRLQEFSTLERDGLYVRMDEREARIYGNEVLDLLEEARRTLCEKYDVWPDKPVIVEIFPRQQDFAIRTFGLPGGAGFLGVCFGRVITANSPASQTSSPANWQAVLWHEFCHVVTLEKTNNRMPRWLSEGISVYEERQRDRAWGQEMTPQYREMILGDDLTPVSELSGAFLRPKSGLHLQFAYYESSLVVEYLIAEYGFEALQQILTDLGVGMPMNEALQRHVGSLEALDREFAAFARRRAEQLAPDASWERDDLPQVPDPEQWAEWLENDPNNYWALRGYARTLISRGHWEEAKGPLQKLERLYPDDASSDGALVMLARVHRELGDRKAERRVLQRLVKLDSDAMPVYPRLLELEREAERWQAVAETARRVLAVNPLLEVGHENLLRAAQQLGSHADVVASLRALAEMEPVDPAGLHYELAEAQAELGERDEARRNVLMALEEAPRYRDAHRLLLRLIEESDAEEAGGEAESTGARGEDRAPDAAADSGGEDETADEAEPVDPEVAEAEPAESEAEETEPAETKAEAP